MFDGVHMGRLDSLCAMNCHEQLNSVHILTPYTRFVQWKTGKVVLKIARTTDVIVCMVCEGGDLELPIHGVGKPAARIGTAETVRQDGGAPASVH